MSLIARSVVFAVFIVWMAAGPFYEQVRGARKATKKGWVTQLNGERD